MTTPPTLEQIARETAAQYHQAKRKAKKTGHITSLIPFILTALQTATKQPQGADWALTDVISPREYNGCVFAVQAPVGPDIARFYDERDRPAVAALVERHNALRPLVANREDSERDSKRLDWLEDECYTLEIGASDYVVVRGEDGVKFNGDTVRSAIDSAMSDDRKKAGAVCTCNSSPFAPHLPGCPCAAMRPAQPERGQKEGTT